MIMQNALVSIEYFESRNFRYLLSKKKKKQDQKETIQQLKEQKNTNQESRKLKINLQ